MVARDLYHRLVPSKVRNPLGLLRREISDRLRRAVTSPPLPSRELLGHIQMTPWVREYLEVGARSAAELLRTLELHGASGDAALKVLDFGCGSARTLRHLLDTKWELYGCDVDREAIEWAQRNIPRIQFAVNEEKPPLPYDDRTFDVVISISLFTHFAPEDAARWITELHRVVRPGGLLALSTMGRSVVPNFPRYSIPKTYEELEREGSSFIPVEGSFNASAAFHTARGIQALAANRFELLFWSEQGLDGFQDLSVLLECGGVIRAT